MDVSNSVFFDINTNRKHDKGRYWQECGTHEILCSIHAKTSGPSSCINETYCSFVTEVEIVSKID